MQHQHQQDAARWRRRARRTGAAAESAAAPQSTSIVDVDRQQSRGNRGVELITRCEQRAAHERERGDVDAALAADDVRIGRDDADRQPAARARPESPGRAWARGGQDRGVASCSKPTFGGARRPTSRSTLRRCPQEERSPPPDRVDCRTSQIVETRQAFRNPSRVRLDACSAGGLAL